MLKKRYKTHRHIKHVKNGVFGEDVLEKKKKMIKKEKKQKHTKH